MQQLLDLKDQANLHYVFCFKNPTQTCVMIMVLATLFFIAIIISIHTRSTTFYVYMFRENNITYLIMYVDITYRIISSIHKRPTTILTTSLELLCLSVSHLSLN